MNNVHSKMNYAFLHKPTWIWNIFITVIFLVYRYISVTWGSKGENPPQILFLPKNIFFGYWFEEGKIKKWDNNGGKWCVDIKVWFKPIFLNFLVWILRKLKFVTSTINPPPPFLLTNLDLLYIHIYPFISTFSSFTFVFL